MAHGTMVQSAGLINDVTSIPPARMLRKLNSGREPTMQFVVALFILTLYLLLSTDYWEQNIVHCGASSLD